MNGSSEYRELLLGCGNRRDKRITLEGLPDEWENLVTLDIDKTCSPDVVYNLERLPWPFQDNVFDEVHGYEVLEHIGQQGDFKAFFDHFHEIWRMLKPNGYLMATCPGMNSPWLWGDPGHKRVIAPESLIYLSSEEYENQVGKTAMTDYRWYWKGDFKIVSILNDPVHALFGFALQAMKG